MSPGLNSLKGQKKRPQALEIDGFAYGEDLLDGGCQGRGIGGSKDQPGSDADTGNGRHGGKRVGIYAPAALWRL